LLSRFGAGSCHLCGAPRRNPGTDRACKADCGDADADGQNAEGNTKDGLAL
jgi:hypothetical protein